MNNNIKPILIGNAYGLKTHGGYGMDVFHPNGVCRCLNATHGGAAETLVIMEHPAILATERTERAKELRRRQGDKGARFSDRQYTVKQNDMSNTITTVQKDNLLIEPHSCAIRTRAYAGKPATIEMGGAVANALTSVQKDSLIVEPQVKSIGNRNPSGHGIGGEVYDTQGLAPTLCVNKGSGYTVAEPQSCAIRTRAYAGQPAAIEMGKDVANALTSVQKDSMVAEPTIQNVGNIYPSGGQGGKVVATTGLAPAVCECHGEVTRIVEPKIIGYSRDSKGKLIGHHLKDNSNTLNCGGGSTEQYVAEPQRTIAYKEMPNGNIRAYDPNTKDLRGISESQITNPNNEAPTVTTSNEPKIMEQQPKYRIRKLTPRECYRLMDVEDSDIDKLLYPIDEKGKPIIPKRQHYKLAGNSICAGVLYHIFRRLFIDTEPTEPIQLELF